MSDPVSAAGYRVRSGELGVRLSGVGAADLTHVSLWGMGLSGTAASPSEAVAELHLGSRVLGRYPVALRDLGGGQRHAAFTEMGVGDARTLAVALRSMLRSGMVEPPPTRAAMSEGITDPQRIEAILRSLWANEATVLLRVERGIARRASLVQVTRDTDLPVVLGVEGAEPVVPLVVDLVGYNSVFRFTATHLRPVGRGLVAVPLPGVLEQRRSRWARRVAAPGGARIRFQHPLWPEVTVERALRDVSSLGLSFEADSGADLLCPGLQVGAAEIIGLDDRPFVMPAEVRLVFEGGDDEACGARITVPADEEALRWSERIGSLLNPRTQMGAAWSEDSWDLYEQSGYFRLSGKSAPHFALLKPSFATVSRKLDAAPWVGAQVVWPSERGIECSISLLRAYSGAIFGFQVARRPDDAPDGTAGLTVLRETHLRTYEHVLRYPQVEWLIGFVQTAARWSRLVHHDVPERYVTTGKASITPFRALEIDPTLALPRSARGPAVVRATEEDLDRLATMIALTHPPPYCESLDLVRERMDLAAVRTLWAGAGLRREREIFVARAGGTPLAAGVFEAADPGLHLFGLFDSVRLYSLAVGGERAYPALTREAVRWYRERERRQFVVLLEGEPSDLGIPFRDLGGAWLTVMSSEFVPNMLEFIYEVTAPRKAEPGDG